MASANRLIGNLKRLAIQPLSLPIPPLCLQNIGEVVQMGGKITMLFANRLAINLNRLVVKPLSLAIPPLRLNHIGKVVQRSGKVGMIWAKDFANNLQRLAKHRLSCRKLSKAAQDSSITIQGAGQRGRITARTGHVQILLRQALCARIMARKLGEMRCIVKRVHRGVQASGAGVVIGGIGPAHLGLSHFTQFQLQPCRLLSGIGMA